MYTNHRCKASDMHDIKLEMLNISSTWRTNVQKVYSFLSILQLLHENRYLYKIYEYQKYKV